MLKSVAVLAVLMLAACGAATGPAGQASSTDVNPIAGSRGGSGSASSGGGAGSTH